MPVTSVSEIHRYPLRPPGFEEPLFPTDVSTRAVMEHLLASPWLARASDLEACTGEAAHSFWEPVRLERRGGETTVVRSGRGRRCPWRRRRVAEVLDRWREVGGWWGKEGVDRMFFRMSLSGGLVVDLALERSVGWFLAGVVD